MREEPDGSLKVTDLADKGRGRFDTGGGSRAATPIGKFVLPAATWGERDEVARSLPRVGGGRRAVASAPGAAERASGRAVHGGVHRRRGARGMEGGGGGISAGAGRPVSRRRSPVRDAG